MLHAEHAPEPPAVLPGPAPDLSRRAACWLVACIALATLALGLTALRAGLPVVFHSDYVQANEAVELLTKGVVRDQVIYPLTLVAVYAAADVAAFAVGTTLGWDGYETWPAFLVHLARRDVHHAIGRVVGALCAALLAVAVYRLARVRFDRRVAVLAAAIAAFCPLQTIYAHQVRPHVPVILLAALAGPTILRAAGQPTLRAGLRTGVAAGLVAAVLQSGLVLGIAATGLTVLVCRPLRALPRVLLGIGAGLGATWLGIRWLLAHNSLVVEGSAGTLQLGSEPEPGIAYVLQVVKRTRAAFGARDVLSDLAYVPELVAQWVVAEPARAAALLGFLLLCALGRRGWRDAVLYGTIPAAMLVMFGLVMGARPRYVMYATPFLAPLAASACLAVPGAVARRLLAALLVLAPLASSVRVDQLLLRGDTRLQLREMAPSLTAGKLGVLVQSDLVPTGTRLPPGAVLFPPGGDFTRWFRKQETPEQTFMAIKPDVFVRERTARGLAALNPRGLTQCGYRIAGALGSVPAFVPDEPLWLLPELWSADRPGPPIDLWASPGAIGRVRAALPEDVRVE